LGIIERKTEVIAALEPFECLAGLSEPIRIPGGFMRFETGANHRMSLDRLLVEQRRLLAAFPKAVGTNRPKMPIRSDLVFGEPAQTLEADLAKIGLIRPAARQHQCVRKSSIVVSDDILKP